MLAICLDVSRETRTFVRLIKKLKIIALFLPYFQGFLTIFIKKYSNL